MIIKKSISSYKVKCTHRKCKKIENFPKTWKKGEKLCFLQCTYVLYTHTHSYVRTYYSYSCNSVSNHFPTSMVSILKSTRLRQTSIDLAICMRSNMFVSNYQTIFLAAATAYNACVLYIQPLLLSAFEVGMCACISSIYMQEAPVISYTRACACSWDISPN